VLEHFRQVLMVPELRTCADVGLGPGSAQPLPERTLIQQAITLRGIGQEHVAPARRMDRP
jgi:hypothetical protein